MLEFRSVSRRVVVCSLWSLLAAALARSFLVSREDERASETSVEEWEGGGGTAAILCFTAQNTSKVLSLPGAGSQVIPTGIRTRLWSELLRPKIPSPPHYYELGNFSATNYRASEFWIPYGSVRMQCLDVENLDQTQKDPFMFLFEEPAFSSSISAMAPPGSLLALAHERGQFVPRTVPSLGAAQKMLQHTPDRVEFVKYWANRAVRLPRARGESSEDICDPGNGEEVGECYWGHLARVLNCQPRVFYPERDFHLSPCDWSNDSVTLAYITEAKRLRLLPLRAMLKDIGCMRNCQGNEYSLQDFVSSTRPGANKTQIMERVTVTTEALKYGPSEALSDSGGYIGLLLGASLLGAFDAAVDAWARLAVGKRMMAAAGR